MIDLMAHGIEPKPKRSIVDVIKEREQEPMDATTTPDHLPTNAELNLFEQAKLDEDRLERQRELDNQISLLISPKNYQRLRAFGFEVVKTDHHTLPPTTTDRRSL